ncbi:MAG TPA: hypothetical protein VFW83_01380 [Bryobacteraceae bacterium]|nr:hypothetical protein [Bryobacteraceae bacterium]
MLRVFVAAVLLALPVTSTAWAANWTEYRNGPLHVISDAGNHDARARLDEMEQLRYVLGKFLGKDNLETVWPIDLVLFDGQREYGPHALSQPFTEGGSATLAAWTADAPLPHDFLRALTRQFIEDNSARMPEELETALCDLFSTIQVDGTKVDLGAPPGPNELPPDRMRAWAKLQMLATQDQYNGTLRVYLNNFQQGGDEEVAAHNAFGITAAELNRRADAYLRAGNFKAAPVFATETVNPNRDFIEARVPESAITELMNELKANGKTFPPESPRGEFAKGTRVSLELAISANPRWAEPHAKLAALETDPAEKIKELKAAANLEPRNSGYWQALAVAEAGAKQYADADKSWTKAERNAPNAAGRARIHQARVEMDNQRAAFEVAERKRQELADAQALQRVKDQAMAEIHAAEAAANAKNGGLKPGAKPVPWFTDPRGKTLTGKLTRVDCLKNNSLRLTIRPPSGPSVKLLVRDPNNLDVRGGQVQFACGAQRPARTIKLVHDGKADAKSGTAGDVSMVEFP